MIGDMLRKVVPEKWRNRMGVWLDARVASSRELTLIYYYLLYGVTIKTLPDGLCSASYQGVTITLPRESFGIFLEVYHDRVYEELGRPQEGEVVMDIGANAGTFTVKAAKWVGERGLVIAVEPEPKNRTLLQRNVGKNHLNNVRIVPKAVWNQPSTARLYLSASSGQHTLSHQGGDFIEVPADTLDNILKELGLDRVNFIKMDIEGAELEALKGAERTLKTSGLRLCIEAEHTLPDGQPELPSLVSFLESRRFQTRVYEKPEGSYLYATRSQNATT